MMGRLLCMTCLKALDNDYPTNGDSHGICPRCVCAWLADAMQDGQVLDVGEYSITRQGDTIRAITPGGEVLAEREITPGGRNDGTIPRGM